MVYRSLRVICHSTMFYQSHKKKDLILHVQRDQDGCWSALIFGMTPAVASNELRLLGNLDAHIIFQALQALLFQPPSYKQKKVAYIIRI